MTRDDIQTELINRVTSFLDSNSDKSKGLDGLNNRLKSFEDFSKKVFDILNTILEENNIDFKDDKEKDEFTEFIKPTILKLITKIILD